ncbi:MAG: hypothetical protein H0W01_13545 [Pseudonocardiales bacterium]|nr:hypothetical protein [Pseudonocardiales bacterium]
MSLWRRLLHGVELPAGFTGKLDPDERVLASAEASGGEHVVVTSSGIWLPEGGRLDWHLISKATWAGGVLTVVAAVEHGTAGDAVLLADQRPRRLTLVNPRRVPEIVHERVTGSIRSRHYRDLPGGGAWFVQRKVPGRDGVVLQVRADPGTDEATVQRLAAEVARRMTGEP